MIQKFDLKNNNYIDSLHDCETSSIELVDDKLIFNFDKKGMDIVFPNGQEMYPYYKLKATYIINQNFKDEHYAPAVRQINQNKHFKKSIIKFYTLKEFLYYLSKNNFNLRFYAQYFNENKCLLIVELIDSYGWQMGNEFNIELLVDEIIYEWIE